MNDSDVAQLKSWSTRWGSDIHIVQGAGGNTSLKEKGRLLVKASGTRLSDALARDIFVEVDLDAARAMADGAPAPAGSGLRPSIETSLHGVMPHRFVAHFHSVEVIAFAVRTDGETALAALLQDFAWGWVRYLKPGEALGNAVRALLAERAIDVVMLGNHGIVIGAESCEEIDRTFGAVRACLRGEIRQMDRDAERLDALAARCNLDPARYPDAHLAAADPHSLAYATAGSLYPDHVVFLGRGASTLGDAEPRRDSPSLLFLAPGAGALLAKGAPDEAHLMAACLGAVVSRISTGTTLRVLSEPEETELLQWDAETYRQVLARADARGA